MANISAQAQANMNVIRDWIEAHNRHDIDGELAFWDDAAEMTIVPTGRTYSGVAELRAAAEMAVKSHGRKTISHLIASDDWVCAEYVSRSTVHGPMNAHNIAIPAGVDKHIELQICFLANIKDGKIIRTREYWDTASMMRQLA